MRRHESYEQDESKHVMSRRSFLGGSGGGAAGIMLLDSVGGLLNSEARAAETSIVGPEPVSIVLDVNGTSRTVSIEPRMTLAEVLRGPLDLTGTKIGCDRGSCSACTVWLDQVPTASCMMLAIDAVGRKITTIEGLAQGDKLHPVQTAFIEHDALQCGFCTPGLVMSCAALVEKNPSPTLDDVKAATSGHLCRCGAYPHVFDATLDAAKSRKS